MPRHLSFDWHCSTTSTFTIPFYLLSIEGADVVLGIEWLRTLGPIKTDFSIPSIAFNQQNQLVTLQTATTSTPTQTSYHQFFQYISTNSIASLHLLSIDSPSSSPSLLENNLHTPSSPLYSLPFPIQAILLQHHTIFQNTPWVTPSKTTWPSHTPPPTHLSSQC